jgi:hypothetical protein
MPQTLVEPIKKATDIYPNPLPAPPSTINLANSQRRLEKIRFSTKFPSDR